MNTELRLEAGVAAVIFDPRGRVLLHMRRDDGGWSPPSGGVRPGESLERALRREIAEETRLDVEIRSLVGVYSDPSFQIVRTSDGVRTHFITTVFRCAASTDDVHGSAEGLAWRWFSPQALPRPMLRYAEIWLADALVDGPPRAR